MIDPQAITNAGSYTDEHGLGAFPSSNVKEDGGNLGYPSNKAFTKKDLVELDNNISAYKAAHKKLDNQTYFGKDHTMAYMDVEKDWPHPGQNTQRD